VPRRHAGYGEQERVQGSLHDHPARESRHVRPGGSFGPGLHSNGQVGLTVTLGGADVLALLTTATASAPGSTQAP
jgi:hypothetical protein